MSRNDFGYKEIDFLFRISLGGFFAAFWLVFIFAVITNIVAACLPLATDDVVLSGSLNGTRMLCFTFLP